LAIWPNSQELDKPGKHVKDKNNIPSPTRKYLTTLKIFGQDEYFNPALLAIIRLY